MSNASNDTNYATAIAITGMTGRFPGAQNIQQFWANIAGGERSIQFFSDEELLAAGVAPATLRQPNYVKAGTRIAHFDEFDASFFGYPPREAEVMDPQHRLFLECAWEALEQSACNPETFPGLIGVFAGCTPSAYGQLNVRTRPDVIDLVGALQANINNDVDSLATTVSYKLNLRGPSLAVQTFCSTSMVAVHLACQSLLTYESDVAIAGGAVISVPHATGYEYQEGGILSPDGYCRTFDANAQGSVMGNGVGVVVLKRMEEALQDGDPIYAVIKGSAITNDGIRKVGYTAPGLAGQSAVIMNAMVSADVQPETIGYLEAHGTATPLGDSIEMAAVLQAFGSTERQRFCALGSVKPNIGHLDRASGVTGLIKTALALQHKQLPPQLSFERTSAELDLTNSPFYINTELQPWPAGSTPRRAGVNSFGLGGTNVHVVLEEAPARPPSSPSRPCHALLLSAKTESALETMTDNLAAHLREHPDVSLADVAYTLQVGRSAFNHRRTVVCRDPLDAAAALEQRDPQRVLTLQQVQRNRSVAFLFPGVGEHYVGMARDLYQHEPVFRATVDRCAARLRAELGRDLVALLYPETPAASNDTTPALDFAALLRRTSRDAAPDALHETALAQPAVFVVEYALAQLLISWGVEPRALLGYSVGEYVAACVSGVLSLDDALRLVATRARLIAQLPAGSMLAVALSESAIQPYLGDGVCLAVVNGPSACVLAGPPAAIHDVAARLDAAEIACRPIATTHAFHSIMLAPIAAELTALARSLTLSEPKIPYLSNVTGTWITAEQATDPGYWARHMVETVRFADGVQALLTQAASGGSSQYVLLEIGPGQTLGSFVRQHPACSREQMSMILGTLRAVHEQRDDQADLLTTLSKLWLLDVPIDWSGFYAGEQRYRLVLPTYPFERRRYWIEPGATAAPLSPVTTSKQANIADWFYQPIWQPAPRPTVESYSGRWLILADGHGLGAALAGRLHCAGAPVVEVMPGDYFAQLADGRYQVRPDNPADYHSLASALRDAALLPDHVVHLWSLDETGSGAELFSAAQERGYYSLLFLTQALGAHLWSDPLQMVVVTNRLHAVAETDIPNAEHATLPGLCTVIGQEHTNITCRNIDLRLPESINDPELIEALLSEARATRNDLVVAYRSGKRLIQSYTPLHLEATPSVLRPGGVYLITGGLGGVGLLLAEYLSRTYQARLVLVGRSGLPPRASWADWLAHHPAEDRTSARIRQVQQIEALGGQVLVLQADVADRRQMRMVLDETRAHFGLLNGVLHAAGISDASAFGAIQSLERSQCETHFQPKTYGLYALEDALAETPLDFCLIFSSISAVLGGLGFGGYAAANSFIDAFTQRHNRTHAVPWVSVNWDTWQLRADQHAVIGTTVAQYEMLPDEGAQAFERVIATYGHAQIVNSTGDLITRINQWVRLEALRAAGDDAASGDDQERSRYPRPLLGTAYVAPSNEVEEQIAAIIGDVLGIEQIGVQDNFFDLGGNSLIGTQIVARLRRFFQTNVPITIIFDAPTVGEMAYAIELILIEEINDLDEMEVEHLIQHQV